MLTKWIMFVRAHTILVVALAVIAMIWHLGAKYEDSRGEKLIAANAVIQQQLQVQVTQNQTLAGQLATEQEAYNRLAEKIRAQNAEIDTAMAAKNAEVAKQQQVDAILPLAGLAIRWRSLENLMPSDVAIGGTGMLFVSGPAATKTVQDLEAVTPLHDEVMQGHQIEDNLTGQLTSLTSVNASQTNEIAGLNSQITLAEKSCQDRIGVVKAQQKKKSGFWFKVGVIAGSVLTGIVLR